ncbi:hypothetical protein GCM10011514_27290 [Emticicia aquatilis]|uniref:histidine kinase n=1 Tax=Emticicia aquatilis TaxID=1537369 RepID=A0A916YU95_9BACT|nr:tetratricopeptide repeat-containing sensor histidine kinase [Emticicia aquatilis]GGD61776.1 hypothetical protein GCM10011514_27290 [Emticicia aquatilis]
MKSKIYFIFLVFLTFQLKAQDKLDSLQKEIPKAKHDSIRLKIYTQIIKSALYSNPPLSKTYAIKFDSTATLLNKPEDIAFGKNYLGMVHYVGNEHLTAINYYLDAIKRFEQLNNQYRVGIALNNIAACYQFREKPLQTIEYYNKALVIFNKLNETTWIGNVSHNIANEYHKLASKEVDKKLKEKYLAEGLKNEQVAIRSFEKNKDTYSIGLSNITFGNLEFVKANFQKAIEYYKNAEKLIPAQDDPESLGMVFQNIGNALYETKKYDESIDYLKKATKIFDEIKSLPSKKITLDILLRDYYEKKDYKNAFETQRDFIELSDSLFNQEKDAAMIDVLKKYESDKKEQENKLLNQQLEQQKQRQLAYLIGLVGLVLFSSIIIYFWYKNRQKGILIESQNQKLSDLNKEKNNLISMVSHDLSTPFLTIKTWNNILKMSLKDNPKALEATEVIQQSSESGITLIKKILDVEKAETNQHELALESFDLTDSVKQVKAEFEEIAKTKNIAIFSVSSPKNIQILSDKHLINRVLENLISNALKYSNPNSKVWITTEELSNRVLLKVKDEGIGISEDDIPKLFTKYGVSTSKPTAGESSTGLGLNIVKRILDEIGGEISCESQLGVGTEFTVSIKK